MPAVGADSPGFSPSSSVDRSTTRDSGKCSPLHCDVTSVRVALRTALPHPVCRRPSFPKLAGVESCSLALGRISDMEVSAECSAAPGSVRGAGDSRDRAGLGWARGGEGSGPGDAVLTWAGPLNLNAGLGWGGRVGWGWSCEGKLCSKDAPVRVQGAPLGSGSWPCSPECARLALQPGVCNGARGSIAPGGVAQRTACT